jgi:hypothetical protein
VEEGEASGTTYNLFCKLAYVNVMPLPYSHAEKTARLNKLRCHDYIIIMYCVYSVTPHSLERVIM